MRLYLSGLVFAQVMAAQIDTSLLVNRHRYAQPSSTFFIENTGQFDPAVRFQVRGSQGVLSLTEDAVWVHLSEQESGRAVNLKVNFADGRRGRLEPFGRQSTHISYYLGNDRKRWREGVPVWTGVRYRGLYRGVDLEITGEGEQLAWRWTRTEDAGVELPPSDALRIEGADEVQASSTQIRARISLGDVTVFKPRLVDALGNPVGPRKSPLQSAGSSEPAFAGAADLIYWTTFADHGDDYATSVAVNSTGIAFVTGVTFAPDFPVTAGALQTVFGGGTTDSFIAKLNTSGVATYVTYFGGDLNEFSGSIALDSTGLPYATGQTNSNNLPVTFGALQPARKGGTDAYVIKLDSAGHLVYCTYLGGAQNENTPLSIKVDATGAAYIGGNTRSSDLPVSNLAFQTTLKGSNDGFVAKINPDGGSLAFLTYLGGASTETLNSLEVDTATGNVYVGGKTESSDFPAFANLGQGGTDGFITKIAANGRSLMYSARFGGSGSDQVQGIALQSDGTVTAVGSTTSSNFPVTGGVYQQVFRGGFNDAFVSKIDAAGSNFVYSTLLGGAGNDFAKAVVLDHRGNAFVAGSTSSTDFPTTTNAYRTTPSSGFVSLVTNSGKTLPYSTYTPATPGDGIALGPYGLVVAAEIASFPSYASVFEIAVPDPGLVFGRVFDDGNANGIQDTNESDMANVTVFLDANGNSVLDAGEKSDQTSSNGIYHMTADYGTLRICVSSPSGYTTTTPKCVTDTMDPAGGAGASFGLITVTQAKALIQGPVGTFAVSPDTATAKAGDRINYRLTWTRPPGSSWHDLDSVYFAFAEHSVEDAVLVLRFDEASQTISLYNPASGRFGPSFSPGHPNTLETSAMTLYVNETAVQGSGPTGPGVTLTFDVSFKPSAAGRTYQLLILGTDDFGNVQGWSQTGTVSVVR